MFTKATNAAALGGGMGVMGMGMGMGGMGGIGGIGGGGFAGGGMGPGGAIFPAQGMEGIVNLAAVPQHAIFADVLHQVS